MPVAEPGAAAFFAALRQQHDLAALATSPLAQLRGVRRLAATRYAGCELAAGLALRDLLQEAIEAVRAELAPVPGEPPRRREERLALEAIARGTSVAATARAMGISPTAQRYRDLYRLRYLLARLFLERAG